MEVKKREGKGRGRGEEGKGGERKGTTSVYGKVTSNFAIQFPAAKILQNPVH